MIISTEVTETSVTITGYRMSQLLRSRVLYLEDQTTRSKGSRVQTTHCLTQTIKSGSCEILKVLVIIDVHVRANKSICESFHCAE